MNMMSGGGELAQKIIFLAQEEAKRKLKYVSTVMTGKTKAIL